MLQLLVELRGSPTGVGSDCLDLPVELLIVRFPSSKSTPPLTFRSEKFHRPYGVRVKVYKK